MSISRHTAWFIAASISLLTLGHAAQADLLIEIDKSTQHMAVSVDGTQLYEWPVSTGASSYETPNGKYRPFRMEIDHYSDEWNNAPMPYSVFFTQTGVAVHGTYERRSLGHAVSHGCVRLAVKNAAILWDLVKKEKMANTSIVVMGDIPHAASSTVTRSRSLAPNAIDERYYGRPLPSPFFTSRH